MASSLSDDFDKIDIKDESKDVGEGVACATCGEAKASKKCKKRNEGCAHKRFCDSACEKKSHEKKEEEPIRVVHMTLPECVAFLKDPRNSERTVILVGGEAEEDNVVDTATITDADIAKMQKKEERKARRRKQHLVGRCPWQKRHRIGHH